MSAHDPMIVFAYAHMRHEFGTLLTQQPTAGAALEPDAIHRMRIATRRLRVALRTFERMLPRKRARKLAKELRWLARRLGAVRDLDVYAENFREYAKLVALEHQPELGSYELNLRRARGEARNELETLFTDPCVTTLFDAFRTLLDAAPTAEALSRWRSFRIADGAAKYLRKSRRRVRRAGRKIVSDTAPEKLHRLRIRAKRLRYELEFFNEVFPELEPAVKATKQLQDVLGEHQDACAASERLRDFVRESQGSSAGSTAFDQLLAEQERIAADARAHFAAEWRRFDRAIGKVKLKKLAA